MTERNEPIIDSFLEEILTGKRPPDQSQSILNRVREDNSAHFLEWDKAVLAADSRATQSLRSSPSSSAQDTDQVDLNPVQVDIQGNNHIGREMRRPRRNRAILSPARWAWGGVGVIAASGLLYLASNLVEREKREGNVGNLGSNIAVGSIQIDATKNQPDSSSEKIASSTMDKSASNSNKSNPSQSLPLDNVPFSIESSVESPQVTRRDSAPAYKIPDASIVDVINQQFESMWRRTGVVVAKEVENTEWLNRITQIMLGRAPNDAERDAMKNDGNAQFRIDFINRLSSTPEFSTHWAWRLADTWLGPKSRGDRSPQRMAFEEWLAGRIATGTPLKSIQREMLLAIGSDSPLESDFQPATHWLASSFEGNSAKLAERLGAGMLDQPIACSRCHDGRVAKLGTYWGTAASLNPIVVESSKVKDQSVRRIRIRKPVESFYDRSDGTMAAAIPSHFDGTIIDKQNESLLSMADWLDQSIDRKLSAINSVWGATFGQKLIPSYGLSDSDGASERRDLQRFLAQQWSAHGEDLRQLIAWIGASRPFANGASSLTLDQYFLATDVQLSTWGHSDRQMAFFAAPYPISRDVNSNARIAELAQWTKRERDDTIRAQPKDMKAPLKGPSKALQSTQAFEHVRLFVHTRAMDPMLEKELDAWLSSKLTWDQLVEHASLVGRGQSANGKFQELAKAVLDQSGGDRKTALSRILLTELGYY